MSVLILLTVLVVFWVLIKLELDTIFYLIGVYTLTYTLSQNHYLSTIAIAIVLGVTYLTHILKKHIKWKGTVKKKL